MERSNIKVVRKVVVSKYHFPIDGVYKYNAQVWTKVNDMRGFVYCGIGKFCKSLKEAREYKRNFLTDALKGGEEVIWN